MVGKARDANSKGFLSHSCNSVSMRQALNMALGYSVGESESKAPFSLPGYNLTVHSSSPGLSPVALVRIATCPF